jgi:hypothetical protein
MFGDDWKNTIMPVLCREPAKTRIEAAMAAPGLAVNTIRSTSTPPTFPTFSVIVDPDSIGPEEKTMAVALPTEIHRDDETGNIILDT